MTATSEYAISFNRFNRILMTSLLAGPRTCRVSIDAGRLRVRMGVGGWAFAATIRRASIVAVAPRSGPVGGWGAHGVFGRWLVNGSSRGLVRITIEPAGRGRCLFLPIKLRQLTLSLDEPDRFIAELRPAGS